MLRRMLWMLVCAWALTGTAQVVHAFEPKPTLDQIRRGKIRRFPQPAPADIELVQHSFATLRRALLPEPHWPNAETVFEDVPLLLISKEHEYLIGHPSPPETHFLVSTPTQLVMTTYGLETTRACDVAAARPLFGAPTVVKGVRSCTGESSTEWMYDYIRRAFRCYLYQHSELLKVSRLNLPFPDPDEKWKSAFTFPFDDPEVIAAVREMGQILTLTFWTPDRATKIETLEQYFPVRRRLGELLEERSQQYSAHDFFRYYTWAEGIPHYAAYDAFEFVAQAPRTPPAILDTFEDFTPFRTYVTNDLRQEYRRFTTITEEALTLEDLALIGALTAGTVDQLVPEWKSLAIERDVWLDDLMARARLESP